MQSVRPKKGRSRDYEAADRLLARSVAVSQPRFAGDDAARFWPFSPQGPAPARRRGTRPRQRRLAHHRLCLPCSAAGYGLWVSGKSGPVYGEATSFFAKVAVAVGFGVKQITIEGQQHLSDAELTAALGAGPGTMMLAFNTDDAKKRLEGVPWIKHAQVMRLLPSTLQVVVEERTPFAVWQSKGQTYVVDAAGAVLAPVVREAYVELPLVVGEGAAKNAADLLITLAPYDTVEIASDRGLQGRRPALDAEAHAWRRRDAARRQRRRRAQDARPISTAKRTCFAKDIAVVDLRLADRVSVRLRDGGETSPDAVPAPDVPTASVKSNT